MDVIATVGQMFSVGFRALVDMSQNGARLARKFTGAGDAVSSAARWVYPQLLSQMEEVTDLVRTGSDHQLLDYRDTYLADTNINSLKVSAPPKK